jgi:hypothetical protein
MGQETRFEADHKNIQTIPIGKPQGSMAMDHHTEAQSILALIEGFRLNRVKDSQRTPRA